MSELYTLHLSPTAPSNQHDWLSSPAINSALAASRNPLPTTPAHCRALADRPGEAQSTAPRRSGEIPGERSPVLAKMPSGAKSLTFFELGGSHRSESEPRKRAVGDHERSRRRCRISHTSSAGTPLPQFAFNVYEKDSRQQLMPPNRSDDANHRASAKMQLHNPHRCHSVHHGRQAFPLPTPDVSGRCGSSGSNR